MNTFVSVKDMNDSSETIFQNSQYRDLIQLIKYQREKITLQQADLTKVYTFFQFAFPTQLSTNSNLFQNSTTQKSFSWKARNVISYSKSMLSPAKSAKLINCSVRVKNTCNRFNMSKKRMSSYGNKRKRLNQRSRCAARNWPIVKPNCCNAKIKFVLSWTTYKSNSERF